MRKLNINNSLTTDLTVIFAEQKRLYQDLYRSRNKCSNNNALETFLMNLDILNSRMHKKIRAKVRSIGRSVKVSLILFRMIKPQGAPGSDGIPIEFYKRCWPLIEEPLINCIDDFFEKVS